MTREEKHEAEPSALRTDLKRETEKERTYLEKALQEEREKLKSLQAALDNKNSKINWLIQKENNIHIDLIISACHFSHQLFSLSFVTHCILDPQVLSVRQTLEAQYEGELQKAKSCMAIEIKELTALLQDQSEEQLRQAQER